MAQNIYDNPEFFAAYTQLPRQVHGLDGAPEWPAIRTMLPDLRGERIVDLGCGCGFGYATRWMREHGADFVLGLDLSQNMIRRARTHTAHAGIEYRIADLDTLELPEAVFDLAYSALTFHYIFDFERLMRVIHKALVHDGHSVFTIEHPIFMAAACPQWINNQEGRKSWPINGYSVEGERRTDWFTKGVLKYHMTLSTTLNTLMGVGFQIWRVEEFAPTSEQIRNAPQLAGELERPMMLMVCASRQ